ncbi:hypothetical protein ABIC83_003024 [Roseateles asaccharophilus]|uniref:hypothetical protein n=1 Tax=Roseateles asaccharophilus TaxID=582607 RepID=UPI0038370D22
MLYLLKTKEDVRAMLWGLEEGRGMPKAALDHLEDLIAFRSAETPAGHSTLRVLDTQGGVTSETKTPIYRPAMFYNPVMELYQPELEDFEIKFQLPAVMYAVCEKSFDRTGELQVAIFDLLPMDHLQVTYRFQAKRSFIKTFRNMMISAEEVGLTDAEIEAKFEAINAASETKFRAMVSQTLGRDMTSDEAWETIFNHWRHVELWLTFIRGRSWADYEAMLASRAA